jgi:hypothetical protein
LAPFSYELWDLLPREFERRAGEVARSGTLGGIEAGAAQRWCRENESTLKALKVRYDKREELYLTCDVFFSLEWRERTTEILKRRPFRILKGSYSSDMTRVFGHLFLYLETLWSSERKDGALLRIT